MISSATNLNMKHFYKITVNCKLYFSLNTIKLSENGENIIRRSSSLNVIPEKLYKNTQNPEYSCDFVPMGGFLV